MKFQDLTNSKFIEFINKLYEGSENKSSCFYMPFTAFLRIMPQESSTVFLLKKQYKSEQSTPGLHTVILDKIKAKHGERAKNKILQNKLIGEQYISDESSFKLHIGLNKILSVDTSVIEGLNTLLIERARNAESMSFFYKIVKPEWLREKIDHRFLNNDQFTLYFDKYSSIKEVMSLCSAVNVYLKKHLPENDKPFGEKDIIGFNSFVTGRFDSNKLNEEYNVYHFYDEQLKIFFERYKEQEDKLAEVPLCVFEVVFNNILIDDSIKDLQKEHFNEQYGSKIQAQFDKLVREPQIYIGNPELLIIEEEMKKDPKPLEKHVQRQLQKRFSQLLERLDHSKILNPVSNKQINEIKNVLSEPEPKLKSLEQIKPVLQQMNTHSNATAKIKSPSENRALINKGEMPENKTLASSWLQILLDRIISLYNLLISLLFPSFREKTSFKNNRNGLFVHSTPFQKLESPQTPIDLNHRTIK